MKMDSEGRQRDDGVSTYHAGKTLFSLYADCPRTIVSRDPSQKYAQRIIQGMLYVYSCQLLPRIGKNQTC